MKQCQQLLWGLKPVGGQTGWGGWRGEKHGAAWQPCGPFADGGAGAIPLLGPAWWSCMGSLTSQDSSMDVDKLPATGRIPSEDLQPQSLPVTFTNACSVMQLRHRADF